jgi:carbon-monoxide dehydrogenase small subunit
VLVDEEPARSCLMLAIQADGASITTVEGLAAAPDRLHPVQQAFWDAHGLQCGFCTSGMLISTLALLRQRPSPSDAEIRAALSGNLCRCTGYQNIVAAVRLAAERMHAADA